MERRGPGNENGVQLPPLSPPVVAFSLGVAALVGIAGGSVTSAVGGRSAPPVQLEVVLPTPASPQADGPGVDGAPVPPPTAVRTTVTTIPPRAAAVPGAGAAAEVDDDAADGAREPVPAAPDPVAAAPPAPSAPPAPPGPAAPRTAAEPRPVATSPSASPSPSPSPSSTHPGRSGKAPGRS